MSKASFEDVARWKAAHVQQVAMKRSESTGSIEESPVSITDSFHEPSLEHKTEEGDHGWLVSCDATDARVEFMPDLELPAAVVTDQPPAAVVTERTGYFKTLQEVDPEEEEDVEPGKPMERKELPKSDTVPGDNIFEILESMIANDTQDVMVKLPPRQRPFANPWEIKEVKPDSDTMLSYNMIMA